MEKAKEKKLDGKKVFLLTLGAGVIVGTGFLAYEHFKNKSEPGNSGSQGADVVPVSQKSEAKSEVKDNDSFPLKIGSRGQRVVQLQQRLEKILGVDKLKEYTPIDGIWGKGTQAALKLAGLPTVIYEASFKSIIAGGTLASGIQSGISKLSQAMSGLCEQRDIITLAPSFVIDSMGNKIPVKKNVILGEEISIGNGMTRFKCIDGTIASVPTRDIRYV